MFLLVVEGKTEKEYFAHFVGSTIPLPRLAKESASKTGIVKEAIAYKKGHKADGKTYRKGDSTWAVFDRDEDTECQNPNDREDFVGALRLAGQNGIEVAYSNDAFELWFLLHFEEVSGSTNRKELDKRLKKYLPDYHHGQDIYERIKNRYEEAVKKAKLMQESLKNIDPVDANPSTTVYLLTEKLRENMG